MSYDYSGPSKALIIKIVHGKETLSLISEDDEKLFNVFLLDEVADKGEVIIATPERVEAVDKFTLEAFKILSKLNRP